MTDLVHQVREATGLLFLRVKAAIGTIRGQEPLFPQHREEYNCNYRTFADHSAGRTNMQENAHYIHPDQLCIGLYVHLDVGWMQHAFTFSNFEIKNQKQIDKIRALGLEQIRYDPQRSKVRPAPTPQTPASPAQPARPAAPAPAKTAAAAAAPTSAPAPAPAAAQPEQKKFKLRAERLMQLNKVVQSCKEDFLEDARLAREATRNFALNPTDSRARTEAMVDELVNSVITERDVVLHAVSSQKSEPEVYVHALNVTVLALMLAKSLDISEQDAHALGVAAMLHDVGKSAEFRTTVVLDQHCENGARMLTEAGLPENVTRVVLQHHELADGTGFPARLQNQQIDPLARLLIIANTFDNLCNPPKPELALSPYQAVAHMYNAIPEKFDSQLLQHFIRCIGVYPPGSIVLLSNGVHGIVMTANPAAPLKPYVMIYAPKVPRKTLVIVDLSEEDLSIVRCLQPSELPKEVLEYFSPRQRVYYYVLKNATPDEPTPAAPQPA